MRNRFLILAVWACAMALAARADAQGNNHSGEFSLLFWSPAPDLRLQSGSLASLTGITEIDFVEEFGIERKMLPEIRFAVGSAHKFRFSYVPVKYEEEAVVQRTITFRGQTFTVGAPVRTDIDWDLWRFGYQWNFVNRDRGYAAFVTELKYNKLVASIDSPLLPEAAATEQEVPIPTIGFAGRGYPHPNVAISGEFTGLDLDFEEFDAKFYDFDINAHVTFGRYIGVQAGYRSVIVDYLVDDERGDLKLKGPYFGVIAKF